MAGKKFEDLPFTDRPDLTPYLVHLTKNTSIKDGYTAFDNLISILMGGRLFASDRTGFIKGKHSATCFMDVPFASLKYVLNSSDSNPAHPRYEPYGIVISKKVAYSKGCRPVLYLSKSEIKQLEIIEEEHWRIVDFEAKNDRWISWLHEREWRCRGDFKVPPNLYCVLVKNADEAQRLQNKIVRNPKLYKIKPRSIVPLTVICQGLTIR